MADSTFDDFVHASLPQLNRHAYAMTGAADTADELVQETLTKMAKAWKRVHRDGNPIAYARVVMANTYLSGWRTLLRRPRSVPLVEDRPGPDQYPLVDTRDQLRRALATLPRDQRVVLVLGYLDDLPDEEIARVLARKPATIRSLRHRALHALRSRLSLEDAEDLSGRA